MRWIWAPAVFLAIATFAEAQQTATTTPSTTTNTPTPKVTNLGPTTVGKITYIPVDTSKAVQPPAPLQSSFPMPSTFFPQTPSFRKYFPTKLSLGSASMKLPSLFSSSGPITNIPLPTPPLPKTVPPPDPKKK